MAYLQDPLPTLLLQMREVLKPNNPPYRDAVPTYAWVLGFSSLSAHRIIQTSQSHAPMGSRGLLTLLILQSLPRSPGFLCS